MQHSTVKNILQEPATAYAANQNRLDLVILSRKGIQLKAVKNLGEMLNLSMKELAALLPVTERTLQRRKSGTRLSRSVSEQVILLAELTEKGVEVFGAITHSGNGCENPIPRLAGNIRWAYSIPLLAFSSSPINWANCNTGFILKRCWCTVLEHRNIFVICRVPGRSCTAGGGIIKERPYSILRNTVRWHCSK